VCVHDTCDTGYARNRVRCEKKVVRENGGMWKREREGERQVRAWRIGSKIGGCVTKKPTAVHSFPTPEPDSRPHAHNFAKTGKSSLNRSNTFSISFSTLLISNEHEVNRAHRSMNSTIRQRDFIPRYRSRLRRHPSRCNRS